MAESNSDSDSEIDLIEYDDEGIELLDHQEELTSLVEVVHKNRRSTDGSLFPLKRQSCWRRACCQFLATIVTLAGLVGAVFLLVDFIQSPLHYRCPAVKLDDHKSKFYLLAEDRVENDTEFLQSFREKSHDHWGWSYDDYKKEMFDWKATRFAELKDGDLIYESASGIGMNLIMTLEILSEVHNVTNIVVYGNEYVPESVASANRLMDHGILPAGGRKGKICQGDSEHLTHVPSNAFDLVYSGYITPLQDPLEYHLDDDDLWEKYESLCKGEDSYQRARIKQMKEMQEDWYAQWVSEMIRIAKPGVPVIVEQVSPSVCTQADDWGGVDKDFWYRAVATYGWKIDPTSIEMEDDTSGNQDGRYHVFMRKSGPIEEYTNDDDE